VISEIVVDIFRMGRSL